MLSTYFTNTGDDLIREGVIFQISQILRREPEIRHIAKANPLSLWLPFCRAAHAPIHYVPPHTRRITRFVWEALRRTLPARRFDQIARCDLFAVAGTPIFYFIKDHSFMEGERLHFSNWPVDMFDSRLDSADAPPMIALGIGSILEEAPEVVLARHPKGCDFIRRFLQRARFVSVRDELTKELLECACPERAAVTHRSLCPSLWAAGRLGITPLESPAGNRAVVSFSLESAFWQGREDAISLRRQALAWTIEYLLTRNCEIVFLSQNPHVDTHAISPAAEQYNLPPPLVPDVPEMLDQMRRGRLLVTWRVHSAMAALSLGTPVLLFTTDSRSQMAEALGAAVLDDRNLDRATLCAILDRLFADTPEERGRRFLAMEARREAELKTIAGRCAEALGLPAR